MAPGAHPQTQGMYAYHDGRPCQPPTWDKQHNTLFFKSQWIKGWNEAKKSDVARQKTV